MADAYRLDSSVMEYNTSLNLLDAMTNNTAEAFRTAIYDMIPRYKIIAAVICDECMAAKVYCDMHIQLSTTSIALADIMDMNELCSHAIVELSLRANTRTNAAALDALSHIMFIARCKRYYTLRMHALVAVARHVRLSTSILIERYCKAIRWRPTVYHFIYDFCVLTHSKEYVGELYTRAKLHRTASGCYNVHKLWFHKPKSGAWSIAIVRDHREDNEFALYQVKRHSRPVLSFRRYVTHIITDDGMLIDASGVYPMDKLIDTYRAHRLNAPIVNRRHDELLRRTMLVQVRYIIRAMALLEGSMHTITHIRFGIRNVSDLTSICQISSASATVNIAIGYALVYGCVKDGNCVVGWRFALLVRDS